MPVVHSEYSALVKLVLSREKFHGVRATEITRIKDNVSEFERLEVANFSDHCVNRLFTL